MILHKGKINAVLASLVQSREVYVPAIVDGVAKFARYDGTVPPTFDMVNTLMPPKDLLFPQTQKMYSFHLGEDGNYHIDEYDDSTPRAVVGIRPCDMRSLALTLATVIVGMPSMARWGLVSLGSISVMESSTPMPTM